MTSSLCSVDAGPPIDADGECMPTHEVRRLPVSNQGTLRSVVFDRDIELVLGPVFASPNRHSPPS